jgi:non-specific serine/threonine protein kinase
MGGEEVPAGFGAVLKRYRLRAGWTQETLAERAGISARAVSDLERGLIRAPQRNTLVRLVGALGLDADERREAEAVAVAVRHRPRPRATPRAAGGRAHNLPAPLTSFVGREDEVPAVRAAVAGHRLVTLTGPGGTGKTRLALEAAAGLLGDYPHGVWLIELAALTDAAAVAHATATAVGVRERAGRSLVDALAEALRPRHALLVLDNCEHLVDACAGLTHTLLRACPRLHFLVTSREALGLAEEVVWRVPPLAVPPPGAPHQSLRSPTAVSRYPAVQLFRDRALAVQSAFRMTDANTPAVAQVCVRLDGIPLALELAAAALRVLSVEQLLERLDDRFRLLPGGRRTLLERHRTLQATIDWSYARLEDPERRLFARLAVFAGGWTLEAAEAVGAGGGLRRADVFAALVRLVDTSLVLVDESRPGGPRYRLLETLRQYASERLTAGDAAAATSERHAAYFVELAATTAGALRGPQQVAALEQLEAEHENLRAALTWLAEAGATGPGLRLVGALWRFWWTRGYWREGEAWLGRFLALPAEPSDAVARGAALAGRAALLDYLGDRSEARALYDESLAVARASGDAAGAALALAGLGHLARNAGDFAAARRRLRESLALWGRAGNRVGTADALRDLAMAAAFDGHHDEARRLYQEALASYTHLGDDRGVARCLEGLADSLRAHGDATAAAACYEESLGLARAVGDTRSVGFCLSGLRWLALDRGDYATAAALLREALTCFRQPGDQRGLASVLRGYAALALARGEPERTLRLLGAAAALREPGELAVLPRADAEHVRRAEALARQQLEGEDADAAWAEGRATPLEQSVADAVEEARRGD